MYLSSKVAAKIYGICERALRISVERSSCKYEFIKTFNNNVGRGGVKLLFKTDIAELKAALKNKYIDLNTEIHDYVGGEWITYKLGEQNEITRDYRVCGALDEQGISSKFLDSKWGAKKDENMEKTEKGCINGQGSDALSSDKCCTDSVLNQNSNRNAGVSAFALADEKKNEAKEWIKILTEWEEAKNNGVSCEKFCKEFGISRSKLFRAQKAYKESGIVGVADKRGIARKGTNKLEDWMKDLAIQKYRAFAAGKLNVTEVWDSLHNEAGKMGLIDYVAFRKGEIKPLFSVGVLSRFFENYYKENLLEKVCATKGYDKAKSYLAPALGSHRSAIMFRNQMWQIDSSPLDAFVRDDQTGEAFKPDILQIIDMFSGRKVATLVKQGNSLALVRLFWKALETFGRPQAVKGDNGKDYLSERFQNLLDGLGIKYDKAIAYAGEKKGMIERSFGAIQASGISQTSGYVGNLDKRQNIEQSLAEKKDRHAKDELGFDKKTNHKHLYSFSQMQKIYETQILKWDITGGVRVKKKITPLDKWNSDETPIVKVDYSEFILYAGNGYKRVVQKNGINLNNFVYISTSLPPVGTEVVVKENIDDISVVFVYNTLGEFICVAKDKEIHPVSIEAISVFNAQWSKSKRKIKKLIEQARLSEFTKREIELDYEIIKKAHIDALKVSEEISISSEVAAIVKKAIQVENIKRANNEIYENYESKKTSKPKLQGVQALFAKKAV